MERLEVKDMHELAVKVSGWLNDLGEYPTVGVVGFYDDIKELMKELIIMGHDVEAIELEYYALDNYGKEFLLYLSEDGISVEKVWNDEFNGYFFIEADIVAVMDNCNSALLKSINADVSLEIGIGDDDADDKDVHTKACVIERDDGGAAKESAKESVKESNEKLKDRDEVTEDKVAKKESKKDKDFEVTEDDDGEIHGFSLSHTFSNGGYASYSYYTSGELTLDDVDKIARLIF